jgi:DNA-binding response OmpR family regulator
MFKVDVADNGKVAETMLDNKKYDLVIIDIRTPITNGKQLYSHIVEYHPDMTEGIIFTTGDMYDEDTKNFIEHSGRRLLPKPFTPDELTHIVDEVESGISK